MALAGEMLDQEVVRWHSRENPTEIGIATARGMGVCAGGPGLRPGQLGRVRVSEPLCGLPKGPSCCVLSGGFAK